MAVGRIVANVVANTSGFVRGLDTAEKRMSGFRRGINRGVVRMGKFATAAAAAGAAIVAALVRRGMQAVDEQAKLARQLGATQDGLVGYQRAAEDAGVSTDVASRAAERLSQSVGEALRNPASRSADALGRLGLSAQDLADMDIDERMAAISDAMRDHNMSADQAADTLRQLGIRQGEVVRLMQEGGDNIRQASREMSEFGVAVDSVDAAQVEAANDAFSRISDVVDGIANQLAVELAPFIEEISRRFTDAARETQGFGDTVSAAVTRSVDGLAFMADAVEGVRRTFIASGQAWATIALTIRREMIRVSATILEGPVDALNTMIRTANRIPGIDFGEVEQPEIAQNMRAEMQTAQRAVEIGREELQSTLMEPLPGNAMREWADDVRERSREAAEATVEDRESERDAILGLRRETADEEDEIAQEAAGRERERRRENLESVRAFLQTEFEAEKEAHAERMDWLEDAREDEMLSEAEFREKKQALEEAHQKEMTRIERRGLSDRERFERASMMTRVGIVSNALEQMTASVARENKTMFRLNQAAGIANAVINTYEGMTQALRAYPPPVSFAMAAAQFASGMSAVQQIRSQSLSGGGTSGGGGGAPSQAGARSTEPGTGSGEAQTTRREITIRGEGITGALIREMIPELNEAMDDGTRLQAG